MSDPVTIEQVIAALQRARDTFTRYANGHAAKGTADADRKAQANIEEAALLSEVHAALVAANAFPPTLAERCREALAAAQDIAAHASNTPSVGDPRWSMIADTLEQLDRVIAGDKESDTYSAILQDGVLTYTSKPSPNETPAPIDTCDAVIEAAREVINGFDDDKTQMDLYGRLQALADAFRAHREARYREIQRAQKIIDELKAYRERLLTLRLESTPEMRARALELCTPDRDDFDRAVQMFLRDIDLLIATIAAELHHD